MGIALLYPSYAISRQSKPVPCSAIPIQSSAHPSAPDRAPRASSGQNFDSVAEYRHGALSYPMFEGLSQNLNSNLATTRARISIALKAERLLTRLKLVSPLFVVAVGQPKA